MDKVSIITPSFNRANVINDTAQSIFNQTYTNWEWVIVDDGSTDNTGSLLQCYAQEDSRVKIFQRNRAPKGACTCRNIAVEKSTGEYLLFLDTDDVLASFCLEQRINAFNDNPDCDFIIFPMLLFKKKLDDTKLLWNVDSKQDDLKRILVGDPICQGTGTLWKKKSFVEIGLWDETLLLWQDIELHLRSLIKGLKYHKRLGLSPDVFIRISDESLSRTGFHSRPKFLSRMQVLTTTIQRMNEEKILKKYIPPLKVMFVDLFENAVVSGYRDQLKNLYSMQSKHRLLNNNEKRILNMFAVLYRYKLYKIPPLLTFFQKKLKLLSTPEYPSTLSKIHYSQPIIS